MGGFMKLTNTRLFAYCVLLGVVWSIGCVSRPPAPAPQQSPPPRVGPPPQKEAPPSPMTSVNPQSLVGTWRGVMTVLAPGFPTHGAPPDQGGPNHGGPIQSGPNQGPRFRPAVELEIFGPDLRGRLTRFTMDNQTQVEPFFGRIENGRMLSRWKDGRLMEFDLSGVPQRNHLSGTHNFGMPDGKIDLDKIR